MCVYVCVCVGGGVDRKGKACKIGARTEDAYLFNFLLIHSTYILSHSLDDMNRFFFQITICI
jgi:hypothetical protein